MAHAPPGEGPQTQPGEVEPAAILTTPEVSTGYRRSRCTSTSRARGKHPGRGTPAAFPRLLHVAGGRRFLTVTAVSLAPPGSFPLSAEPDQVIDADEADSLIDRELNESRVAQRGHPLLWILVPHRHAEQPVVRVLADARHGPD